MYGNFFNESENRFKIVIITNYDYDSSEVTATKCNYYILRLSKPLEPRR